jgi:hypothetical protein
LSLFQKSRNEILKILESEKANHGGHNACQRGSKLSVPFEKTLRQRLRLL